MFVCYGPVIAYAGHGGGLDLFCALKAIQPILSCISIALARQLVTAVSNRSTSVVCSASSDLVRWTVGTNRYSLFVQPVYWLHSHIHIPYVWPSVVVGLYVYTRYDHTTKYVSVLLSLPV